MNYFDLHCDTISECCNKQQGLYQNTMQLSLRKGNQIKNWIQTYAIWMDDELSDEGAYHYFNQVYHYFLSQMNVLQGQISFCKNYREIEAALAEGKKVALLAIEGSRALGRKIERVEEFYNKGVRMMTLTWNGKTHVADGCMLENPCGLTHFGKQVVCKMEEVGMLIDVSHLAEKGFWDVVKSTHKPFIATHSNSKAVCNHPRNLTDKQFQVFVDRKGLVGINYYSLFTNGTLQGDIKEILPHIDHFLELGGENVIAMGSDFDGAKMPNHMKGIGDVGYLYQVLVRRYGKAAADKFFFENAQRFMCENL